VTNRLVYGRREFITLIGGAAAAWPLAARAQQAPGRLLIGVLSPATPAAATRNIEALRAGLRDLGYVEDRNVTLVLRFGEGVPARLPELAAELVALKPDVILAGSVGSILAARNATRAIPLIMTVISGDPVALGLVSSIARPGGNITGIWMFGDDSLVGKRLEFLKHVVPGLARIGVIINPGDSADAIVLERLPATARALGIDFVVFEARTPAEFGTVFAASARDGMQALFVSQSPLFFSNRAQATAMAARVRLPAIYGFREFAEAGGLMSYGANLPNVYRQSARLMDKIFKGVSPADLPVEVPTRFELIVNLKAAKAIGLTISDSFLSLADEVIE
jgi:putative tryptophan/tyrosine transport system substrate-binding protein